MVNFIIYFYLTICKHMYINFNYFAFAAVILINVYKVFTISYFAIYVKIELADYTGSIFGKNE